MPDIRHIQRRDLIPLSERFTEQTADYFETLYLDHLQERCQVWVALDITEEDRPHYLGYVRVLWSSDYTQFWRRNIPEITDFYVHPTVRGQGIGQALIRTCERAVQARGQGRIGISIQQVDGYERLLILYKAWGYQDADFGRTTGDDQLHLVKSLSHK